MKIIIACVLWLTMGGLGAFAQQKSGVAGDEAAIKALESKWDAATLKGDAEVLASVLADTFTSTGAEGKLRTKAEYVGQMKSGEIKFQSAKIEEMKVTLYGDAAVVNGRWRGKFTEKGKVVESHERFTDTFVRQGGQWRCVASHSSVIK